MKITAWVTFAKCANREFLIRAFFEQKEYSPQNRIRIVNDEVAFIQLEFTNRPPLEIINAISHCSINSLDNSGDTSIEELINEYYATQGSVSLTDVFKSVQTDVIQNDDAGETEQVDIGQNDDASEMEQVDIGQNDDVGETEQVDIDQNDNASEVEQTDNVKNDNASEMEQADIVKNDKPSKTEEVDVKQNNEIDNAKQSNSVKNVEVAEVHIKKRRYGKTIPSERDYMDIPKLDELSVEVNNFADFTIKIGEWLNLQNDVLKFYINLLNILSMIDQKGYELKRKQVVEANKSMGGNDYTLRKYEKVITSRLESIGVYSTLLYFNITVLKYKDYYLKGSDTSTEHGMCNDDCCQDENLEPGVEEYSSEDVYQEENIEESSTSVSVGIENPIPKKVESDNINSDAISLMQCENFKKVFDGINKNQTIEEIIEEFFTQLGLKKYSELLYRKVCKIAVAAFSMDSIASIDDVMLNAGYNVGTKDGMKTKIRFSEWINDFNKVNHIKKMKSIAFLRAIKSIFSGEITLG